MRGKQMSYMCVQCHVLQERTNIGQNLVLWLCAAQLHSGSNKRSTHILPSGSALDVIMSRNSAFPYHKDSLKLFLRLPSKVPDQPLVCESILGRHPVSHHGVQESLPLSCIETQNLSVRKMRSSSTAYEK